MVAAEQLNRTCYGMEIEPKYCAVILERMEQMGVVGVVDGQNAAA
jgi:DNA modification methylase